MFKKIGLGLFPSKNMFFKMKALPWEYATLCSMKQPSATNQNTSTAQIAGIAMKDAGVWTQCYECWYVWTDYICEIPYAQLTLNIKLNQQKRKTSSGWLQRLALLPWEQSMNKRMQIRRRLMTRYLVLQTVPAFHDTFAWDPQWFGIHQRLGGLCWDVCSYLQFLLVLRI